MPSFDIVSKSDMAEVDNAIQGVDREIGTRFDFKGSKCTIERAEQIITILADDQPKMDQMQEMLKIYFTRRKIDPNYLDFSKPAVRAAGDAVRQEITIKEGIDRELAKTITKMIKDNKLKVQASIQGDEVRVTGKKRDDLQEAIALLKSSSIEQPLQYINFRD